MPCNAEPVSAEATVIIRRQGRIGRLTINRSKALNAIDHDMVRAIRAALDAWQHDPAVHAVVIEGAGDRAFCAGGDIRHVRGLALAGRHAEIEAFFVDEYALNLAIARFPKPYVALIDGACMGGGMGLSMHGSLRIATEHAVLAMPETGIGFFPDVGASFFLPRLRPGYGMFLALTGTRLNGADAMYLGLATHFASRDRLRTLADEMAENGVAALAEAALRPLESMLPRRAAVGCCFEAGSVAEIIQRLTALDDEAARDALVALRSMSPTSVMTAFELMQRGAHSTLEQCLATELALTRHASRHPDFAEGVRAMVIDKDRTPRWSPARLEDVDPAMIARRFQ